MNKRAYLANFTTLIMLLCAPSLPSCATPSAPAPDTAVPWASTFAGINAPVISPQPLVSTSPFQSAAAPSSNSFQPASSPSTLQNQQQTNNPFSSMATTVPVQIAPAAATSTLQLLTSPSTPLSQKINGMFTTNTTVGGQPMKVTPGTKYRLPPAAQTVANLENISFTQQNTQLTHPPTLFPNNPALLQAYTNFMNALKDVPSFFPLFRKIHITALHQIYLHLVGIYTSLNMTHMDDLKTYMATEKKYALNKKTLIINHLINVVMAQLNQALRALIPGLPESYAIATGMGCMQADNVSDPNMLVLDIEKYVLSTLGLEQITSSQTSLAYLGVRHYMALAGIQTSPELEAALISLNSTPFSIKTFTKEQATALSNTMYTILAYLNQEQNLKNLDAIIGFLRGTNTQEATSQEVNQLAQLITDFSYEKLLTEEIAFTQRLNELLGKGDTVSTTTLPPEEILCLKNLIGWILKESGKVLAQKGNLILDVLGKLNPTYQILSPSQEVQLKALALRMLGSKTKPPVLLENISAEDRTLLAYGLWTTSNNTESSLSASEKATAQSIATPLKEHSLTLEGLTKEQQIVLQKALVGYSTYTLQLNDDRKKEPLTTASLPAPGEKTPLENAMDLLSSSNFTTLDKLPTPEQIALIKQFQTTNQFIEKSLETNEIQGGPVQYLFSQNTTYKEAFLKNITIGKYLVLLNINKFLKKGPVLSFKTFVDMRPYGENLTIDPLVLLRSLFAVSAPHNTSYTDILLRIQKDHLQDETTAAFVKTISPDDILAYRAVFALASKPDFSFDHINQATSTALANTLTAYKKSLTQNRSVKYTRTANNNDRTQHALETIADFISYSQQSHSKRTSFLWVLKEYLAFFNLYAQTLQNVSADPSTPSYTGLTQFADYAKNIQQELAYESSSNNSIAALLKKTNPPLFFYDKDTFRGIRLLPKLAQEIENSPTPISVAPFPTFGIEQASSATETARDPLTGNTVSNATAIGSFPYKKFFFLQAPDSITELTGTLPAWIKKTIVPSTNSAGLTTLYEPNNLPTDGITGFYMNIPLFAKDPTDKNSVLIRLFEQPIIAQPAWLNASGTGPKTPKAGVIPTDSAGVITVLRGCLGDFQSILDLNIFDPCLTVIFSSALALSDTDLDVQTSKSLIQDKGGKCAAFIKQKEALLKHQEDPQATINQNLLGNALPAEGATLPLPPSALTSSAPIPEPSGVSQ
jgi:hypothetical protein